jgi:alcohol dehydrogenase YqhD (iron-dependent ADH family)
MKWLWLNRTQVAFGVGAVKEHLSRFVKANSRIICTFGGGSIDQNGCRADVQAALDALHCEVTWAGGIQANPDFDQLMKIVALVREKKPDLLLAVGGGSVIDGTKFIVGAAKLPPSEDCWRILSDGLKPEETYPFGSVLTLPATGSEWNSNFVISWRAKCLKLAGGWPQTFPQFSLVDPVYTMSLPVRQVRNGVYDAITHCIDQFLTGQENPMMDDFWIAVIRELVVIGPEVIKPNSSLELHERLIQAASFALNFIFTLGKEDCWAIHQIGHALTAKYDIDHGATLSIVGPTFLETFVEQRKALLAKCAEGVFGVQTGTQEEKARAFIARLREFIVLIGEPSKVTDWKEGPTPVKIGPNDIDELTKMIMEANKGQAFGWRGCATEQVVRDVLRKVVV